MKTEKLSPVVPITLGLLSALGPFVTDFYLPVMPEMAEYFQTTPSLIGASLTASMIGFAGGQLFIGPLTDKYGRKKILLASMLLFVVATLLIVLAPNIHFLNAMRLLQGLGGAGGIVVAKSMATDLYTGDELVRFMALLGAITGIAPVAAPVVGGVLTYVTTWKGFFLVLFALGLLLLALSATLRETLAKDLREKGSVLHSYANLFNVLKNPLFTSTTLVQMAGMFVFFAYISSSSFILEQTYQLSPLTYSICLGLNAIMISVGSAASVKFKSVRRGLITMCVGFFASCVAIAACILARQSIVLLMVAYLLCMFFYGIMIAITNAVAMDSERQNAGSASAVFGAMGFFAGAVASPLTVLGDFHVSTSALIVAGGLMMLGFTWWMLSKMQTQK